MRGGGHAGFPGQQRGLNFSQTGHNRAGRRGRGGIGRGIQDARWLLRAVRRGRVPGHDLPGMRRHDDVEVVARGHGAAIGEGKVDVARRVRGGDLTALELASVGRDDLELCSGAGGQQLNSVRAKLSILSQRDARNRAGAGAD